jgi:hypothetical protein
VDLSIVGNNIYNAALQGSRFRRKTPPRVTTTRSRLRPTPLKPSEIKAFSSATARGQARRQGVTAGLALLGTPFMAQQAQASTCKMPMNLSPGITPFQTAGKRASISRH